MGVISVSGYRPVVGKTGELFGLFEEGRALLQELEVPAASMRLLAGSEPGSIAMIVNYADATDWAATAERLEADSKWQEFMARAEAAAAGELIEQALYNDIDPTFTPRTDRPLGAATVTQWRPRAGQAARFIEHVTTAKGHLERLGGYVRILQSVMNNHPMTMTVSVTFEDLAHLAEHQEKLGADEQWAAFWAGVMADPAADLVRTGTYKITV